MDFKPDKKNRQPEIRFETDIFQPESEMKRNYSYLHAIVNK